MDTRIEAGRRIILKNDGPGMHQRRRMRTTEERHLTDGQSAYSARCRSSTATPPPPSTVLAQAVVPVTQNPHILCHGKKFSNAQQDSDTTTNAMLLENEDENTKKTVTKACPCPSRICLQTYDYFRTFTPFSAIPNTFLNSFSLQQNVVMLTGMPFESLKIVHPCSESIICSRMG